MELRYELKGGMRKPLVKALEEITGIKAQYLGMPDMAYKIGTFTVSKEGTVSGDTDERVRKVREILADTYGIRPAKPVPEAADGFTVMLPKENADIEKLIQILDGKGELIKKALGVSDLPVKETADMVTFPWFGTVDTMHRLTYTRFIKALGRFSRDAKRVHKVQREIVNEKYTFRCFLLRLGFIGKEWKQDRRILLERLEGSAAFRNGGKKDETSLCGKN